MNTAGDIGCQNPVNSLICLIGHVGRLLIWEPKNLPKAKRLARLRANERRKKIIRALSADLTRALQKRWLGI